MHVWTHHRWRFPLPDGHKFPISKYELLCDRVVTEGLCTPEEVHEAEPVPPNTLICVRVASSIALPADKRKADAASGHSSGLSAPAQPA